MKMRHLLRGHLSPLVPYILMFLAAFGSLVGIEHTPTLSHAATATVAVLPTENARSATQIVALATPTPMPSPTKTPTPVCYPTPAVAPGTTVDVDCADVAPFASGCLDQPRPPGLAPDIAFVGILPAGPVQVAAWSPDGTRLAYAVVNLESGAFQGLEVRSLPDFCLEGRWSVPGIFDLTWTPDGQAVLFVFDRGDTSSIGLARLGEPDWHDLLPGEKAVLAVSLGKNFVDWLGENVLAFGVGCGTGCETLYSLDITTGDLRPLVNAWDEPDAPYADVFATVYLFSPDHRWLAATSWGRGLPEAMVLEWPGPAEPLDLSARLDTHYSEAQSWADGSLSFVAYPPGDPDTWVLPPCPDLYVWEAHTGAMRHVASGAFRAIFAPTGDRLAVLFVGEPWASQEGPVASDGSTPHLGLLSWPEGRLLAVQRVNTKGISDVFDLWRLPIPIWSPQGQTLAFQPAGGGLALMNRDGHVWPVLTGQSVNWVGWGTGGNLALLVGEQVWLVRGVLQEPTSGGTRPSGPTATYEDQEIGYALDYPADWHMQASPGWAVILTSYDPTNALGRGGVPSDQTKVDLLPDKPHKTRTLEELVAEAKGGAEPVRVLWEERWELDGAVPAVRVQIVGQGEMALLLTVINGRSLRMVGYGDLTPFDAIAYTLRPASPIEAYDLGSARQALIAFFSRLHDKHYSEALEYYGGPYDVLRDWNPTVARNDYSALFKNGCTMNGLKCLRIRTIVHEEQVSPTEFRFIVEFVNDDGTLFVRGPCCGTTETEMPSQTQFAYTVKKIEDRSLVQDLPVYVP